MGKVKAQGRMPAFVDEQYKFFAGKFEGMPSLFVMVGSEEKIHRHLECSLPLAGVAQKVGASVELYIVPGIQHIPDEWLPVVPKSVETCTRSAVFIDYCFQAGR